MAITAQMVKELREKTGVGMMDCKAALNETKGDLEAAVDWLRTKGLAKAAKKAGRVAVEGLVAVAGSGERAAMIELNSETDFVARNDQFQTLAKGFAEAALKTDGKAESVLKASLAGGKTVEAAITDAVSTIGENITLRRSAVLSVEGGVVASYVHAAIAPGLGKIGVLIGFESTGDKAKVLALGRQIAMHVDPGRIDPATIARERAIFAEQARESGKPDSIIEKMVEGRLRKFYEESTLLKQAFVIDSERTVEAVLKDAAKDLGGVVSVTDFVVFRLGEGIQREDEAA
jgi:elongation factor Ts